jgi:hypothetical protein
LASTILEAIGSKLQTDGIGTLGTNIFLSLMPDTPDVCIAVYEYEGLPPLDTFGASVTVALDRPSIQVMTRASRNDYVTGRDKAVDVRNSLAKISNQSLSGIQILRIAPTSAINSVGLDEKDRPLATISFTAVVVP